MDRFRIVVEGMKRPDSKTRYETAEALPALPFFDGVLFPVGGKFAVASGRQVEADSIRKHEQTHGDIGNLIGHPLPLVGLLAMSICLVTGNPTKFREQLAGFRGDRHGEVLGIVKPLPFALGDEGANVLHQHIQSVRTASLLFHAPHVAPDLRRFKAKLGAAALKGSDNVSRKPWLLRMTSAWGTPRRSTHLGTPQQRRLRPFIDRMGPTSSVLPIASRVDRLPVLPMVVARLLALNPNADDYFDQVVELVGLEPTYAARLLVAANSVEARGHQTIETILDAVVRLGASRVSSLVVNMSVVRVFVPQTPMQRALWVHAVQVACGARHLARLAQDPELKPEQAYLAGLLHDIGHFLMLDDRAEELASVEAAQWSQPLELLSAEESTFGCTHAEVGARAAEQWGFPESVVQTIRLHHSHRTRIERLVGQRTARLTEIISLADHALFSALCDEETAGLDDPEVQKRLKKALPKWYPKPTKRFFAQMQLALDDATQAVHALGI